MLLKIDNSDERPIYLQIINQVKEQISKGILQQGDELPSVREVADSLGINLHTVRGAYLKLRDQGIINLHLGRRATVARRHTEVRNLDSEEALKTRLRELITDALLLGLSVDDIRGLIDQQLEHLKEAIT
jgi:GntR family transcriptional regulator